MGHVKDYGVVKKYMKALNSLVELKTLIKNV